MNWGYLLTIASTFVFLFLVLQRIPTGPRRWFRWFIGFVLILLLIRGNLLAENLIGFIIGSLVSFLFWLLIGRYNPTGSGDEIKVYGLDD